MCRCVEAGQTVLRKEEAQEEEVGVAGDADRGVRSVGGEYVRSRLSGWGDEGQKEDEKEGARKVPGTEGTIQLPITCCRLSNTINGEGRGAHRQYSTRPRCLPIGRAA